MSENKPNKFNEEQEQIAILIEKLSTDMLKDLKNGKIDIDIEALMNAIQTYANYPEHYAPAVTRWKERLAEITQILEEQYSKAQRELKNLVDNNAKLTAYDKNQQIKE